jgi:hypothetical protein
MAAPDQPSRYGNPSYNRTTDLDYRRMTTSCIGQRILALTFAFATLAVVTCVGQDIPKGVNYKKVAPEINEQAKAALERALSNSETPTNFLSEVISCGPILWNDLGVSQESLLKDSTPVTMFLSLPEPVQAEGRGFRTQEQRDRFWKLVLEKYPDLRKGVVRPARENEIRFYWATIPFDIEEPFFAVETPSNVFVANLKFDKNTTVLFWLDRVDDLRKLKKR